MVNKPVAPKTTRSYVRPCCLNPISSTCGVAAEIYQIECVMSAKMYSVCPSIWMDSIQGAQRVEFVDYDYRWLYF